jgi:hypothetical protein
MPDATPKLRKIMEVKMHSVTLRSHVGPDGILNLQVPSGIRDADVEVMVIMQPLVTDSVKTPANSEWPPGFFEQTFGSIPDLERPPQGELPEREPLE